MDDIAQKDFEMPPIEFGNKRIVLEHTKGRLQGIHSICGLQRDIKGTLPEVLDAVELIDAPSMREPGPVSLVAVKSRYALYRQIYTPTEMQGRARPGAPFNRSQR